MGSVYRCNDDGRRQYLAGDQDRPDESDRINAIDFVVVDDDEDGPASFRQRLIWVRFLRSRGVASLGTGNVAIRGGVRITPVGVLWAKPVAELASLAGLTAGESSFLSERAAQLSALDCWLVVHTDVAGDFSPYTLSIRAGQDADEPPTGFDVLHSSVELWFKASCPSPLDCRRAAPGRLAEPGETPAIDYLAKDYASFRRLMLDRLASTQPGETSTGAAELRTVLVELLAYAADLLSYYQDAVGTEAYLGTARRRVSVARHVRLLDYSMHEGCNARAWVHLAMRDGEVESRSEDDPVIAAGTVLLTRLNGCAAVLSEADLAAALSRGPAVFATMEPVLRLRSEHNAIELYTWGDRDCTLPRGSTSAVLAIPTGGDLDLRAGDGLLFEQIMGADTGLVVDADPARRHIVRLTAEPLRQHDELYGKDVLVVSWAEDDALPFSLCVAAEQQPMCVARANLVLVDHGRPIAGEPLEPQSYEHDARPRPRLARKGVSWREPVSDLASRSAAQIRRRNPRAALPQVQLDDGGSEHWQPRRTLLSSSPSKQEMVIETESDGRAYVRFGDGTFGRRPADGTMFRAHYRVGNGRSGNVGAETISHLVSETLQGRVAHIRNPLPAEGGEEPEAIELVKLYAPQAFRIQERAVTEEDWAEVALRHPEVQRAVAKLHWTGSWHTIHITVDRRGGLPVDEAFTAELLAHFERYRLAGYDLEICAPIMVPLDIVLTVCADRGYQREHVAAELLDIFSSGITKSGERGFFHPDSFTFGQPVYLSQIIARAMAVAGVSYVDATPGGEHRFQRWGRPTDDGLERGKLPIGELEIARCDSDPSMIEHGRISFLMEGGS